ncbi:MAG: 50S ribosomal protein L2 [Planctomycetes bacterium]|nr:50S ribosomal protein L2 [Planctomycetota bacterium]
MAIKSFKPRTASLRHTRLVDYTELSGSAPLKSKTKGKKATGGRNNRGRQTAAYRGGGHKRRYREIDFRRDRFDGVPATVKAIEYDPNRTCFVAQIWYANGHKDYIIAPHGMKEGDVVMSGEKSEPRVGNCLPLHVIPQGLAIHCVELQPGKGGQLARGAGSQCILSGKVDDIWMAVQMPSGEIRKVHKNCRATIGQVSNLDHMNISIGKAGRNRWLGRKPKNRGTSKNPVDHPMGGGNDRTGGGRSPVDRHGNLSKGQRTRRPKNQSNKMIIRTRRGKQKAGKA